MQNTIDSTTSAPMSTDLYKRILDNTMECIWALDLSSEKYLYISPSVFQLRGLTAEEAMQETLEDSLTPDSLQKIRNSGFRRFKRFLAGDRSAAIVNDVSEYEQYCKDGTTIFVEISTRIIFNHETNSVEIIGVSRDITRKKQHEKKLLHIVRKQNEKLKKTKHHPLENMTMPRIYLFGKFNVFAADSKLPIKWRTSKSEELMAFLLNKDKPATSKTEICDALWPEADLEKAAAYLYTTIYNLKKDLKKAQIDINIKQSNGFYYYDMPEIYNDLTEIKNLIKNAVAPFSELDDEAAHAIEQALVLYGNGYLSENGYPWAISKSAYYRNHFEKNALSLTRYYFYKRNYPSTKNLLLKLISFDNLNERYHELLLKVYILENDYDSFIDHYDHLKKLLLFELDVTPCQSIEEMHLNYQELAETCSRDKTAHF